MEETSGDKDKKQRFWGTRCIRNAFEEIAQVGEGTYGLVYKARCKYTNELVALKKVRIHKKEQGLPVTSIREIKILQNYHHPNLVQLKEIATTKSDTDDRSDSGDILLVFEYIDHDLTGLNNAVKSSQLPPFLYEQIASYMQQLLEVLDYLHSKNLVHRDIKCSNLLISRQNVLKLADFGLARSIIKDSSRLLTNKVITLWYRPPELLMGTRHYSDSVDLWSVGCIMAELFLGKPVFPGKDEMDQIHRIFSMCGSPTDENWPNHHTLPWWKNVEPVEVIHTTFRSQMKRLLMNSTRDLTLEQLNDALDLMSSLLTLDPAHRISAKDALNSNFFKRSGSIDPHKLPHIDIGCDTMGTGLHEYGTKKARRQQQQQQRKSGVDSLRTSSTSIASGGNSSLAGEDSSRKRRKIGVLSGSTAAPTCNTTPSHLRGHRNEKDTNTKTTEIKSKSNKSLSSISEVRRRTAHIGLSSAEESPDMSGMEDSPPLDAKEDMAISSMPKLKALPTSLADL